jgi:hypothetical protein
LIFLIFFLKVFFLILRWYMWDTENTKSFEPLCSLQMGDEPIVAFDFQVLGESHDSTGDNICVIAVTKELSLRVSFFILNFFLKFYF